MSLNYYADFAKYLKQTRQERMIELEAMSHHTRIPLVYLESIERAEFDFASPVLIQGYLRQYARFIGMDEEAVVRQYGLILKKIDYVSSDHHLPPPFLEQPAEPMPIRNTLRRSGQWIRDHAMFRKHPPEPDQSVPAVVTADDPLAETARLIDDEVARKWLAERQLTNRVTAFCICLLFLCFVFFFVDNEPPVPTPNTDSEPPLTLPAQKPVTLSRKIQWNLSPALLTQEDLSEKEKVRHWLEQDSQQILQNLINHSFTISQFPKPITVHECFRYLNEKD